MLPFRYLLIIATVLAFILPQPGIMGKDLLIWVLSGSILFALLATKQKFSFDLKAIWEGLIYCYILLAGAMIALSFFYPADLRAGLILYALFPPAISMIGLSEGWGGDVKGVFLFLIVSYSVGIFAIPIAAQLLIGAQVNGMVLFNYLIYSFAIPVVIAQFISIKEKAVAHGVSNLFLALLFYIIIATHVQDLVDNFWSLLPYMGALFLVSFVLTYLVYRFVRKPEAVLYSFMKNGGAAAGVAALVLPPFAAIMISAKVFIDIILIVIFEKLIAEKKA